VAVAVAVAGMVPLLVMGAPSASAALRPVAGCGYRFGALSSQGAAGTVFYSVLLVPNSPAQQCTTAVRFTAAISPTNRSVSYTNIDDNPLTATETVSFARGRRQPSLIVGWAQFHCAEPAVPGSLVITAGNQGATTGVTPNSCGSGQGPGQHSFLEPWTVAVLSAVGIAPTRTDDGYRTVETDGYMTPDGDATTFGATAYSKAPAVGIQGEPIGNGVWVVASDGAVFSYGGAPFHGSLGATPQSTPIVGMAAIPDGVGYWLVSSNGAVYPFGNAALHGSLTGTHLSAPIVGIVATSDGGGYWLVASDGGVFAFGDAKFDGSLGTVLLNAPIVGMAAGPHGGYWLVASDGGVFAFGGVPYEGSMGGTPLNAPIAGMAATSSGHGYWLVGSDNGVFTFGDAKYFGSSPITP
jgi:hypothetical protein